MSKTSISISSLDELRRNIKEKRQTLSKQAQDKASNQFCQAALNLSEFKHAKHIGLYYPIRGELDVFSLFKLRPKEKQFYLPLIQKDKTLLFTEITDNTQWQTNKYGIKEPIPNTLTPANKLDLVFCPLVAFDKNNYRIGQGGGYYDRTFSFKLDNAQLKPWLIGAAYCFQEIDVIHPQNWDVMMNQIIAI